jgi:hypothetical protein
MFFTEQPPAPPPPPPNKRELNIIKYGYDVKHAYHCIRLLNEVEQILVEGDLDLERNNEQLKTIRKGEWKLDDVQNYFTNKEKALETAYANSTLPHSPDQVEIRKFLHECLESHYGTMYKAEVNNNELLADLMELLQKYT